jgi:predicted nucleotidyltransferase component of viral defense system
VIPQRNISLLSNRLAKTGGRRIREDVLERDYCLAWFLAALADSDLKRVLAFKRGTALKRCYFRDYRFSEDLDFTLIEPVPFEEIKRRLETIYRAVRESSGITFEFEREDRNAHANSHTFYLKYVGPLPAGNDVKVDITIQEKLVDPPKDRAVLRGYEEFSDIPEDRRILVYMLEEILAEKVMALADRARNEPRDLYDFWYLTSQAGVGVEHVANTASEKLQFRKQPSKDIDEAIRGKEARLKVLWSGRLVYQMVKLPEFDEVFRSVRRTLRQAHLP